MDNLKKDFNGDQDAALWHSLKEGASYQDLQLALYKTKDLSYDAIQFAMLAMESSELSKNELTLLKNIATKREDTNKAMNGFSTSFKELGTFLAYLLSK